jgi:hypothetical protein
MLAALIFGWPTIGLSLALGVIGAARRQWQFLALSALAALPSAYYLAATPRFRFVGLAIPVFLAGAALTCGRKSGLISWLLIMPPAIAYLLLALTMLSQ